MVLTLFFSKNPSTSPKPNFRSPRSTRATNASFDPHLPQSRARHAGDEHHVDRSDPGADAASAAVSNLSTPGERSSAPDAVRAVVNLTAADPDRHRHLLTPLSTTYVWSSWWQMGSSFRRRKPPLGHPSAPSTHHHGRHGVISGWRFITALGGFPDRAGRDGSVVVGRHGSPVAALRCSAASGCSSQPPQTAELAGPKELRTSTPWLPDSAVPASASLHDDAGGAHLQPARSRRLPGEPGC